MSKEKLMNVKAEQNNLNLLGATWILKVLLTI